MAGRVIGVSRLTVRCMARAAGEGGIIGLIGYCAPVGRDRRDGAFDDQAGRLWIAVTGVSAVVLHVEPVVGRPDAARRQAMGVRGRGRNGYCDSGSVCESGLIQGHTVAVLVENGESNAVLRLPGPTTGHGENTEMETGDVGRSSNAARPRIEAGEDAIVWPGRRLIRPAHVALLRDRRGRQRLTTADGLRVRGMDIV